MLPEGADTMNTPPQPNAAAAMASRPHRRGWLAWLGWALVALYFAAGALFLLLREVVLPRIDDYRPQIVSLLTRASGLPVSIERLSADWSGLRPRLHLAGVTVRDAAGQAALQLPRVDATLAWSSLWRARVHFHHLEIVSPMLAVRRAADGALFVAGLPVTPGGDGGGLSEWLLAQRNIVIRDALLTWSDELRGAPVLRLEHVNMRLTAHGIGMLGGGHRFGLQALPPIGLAAMLDVRGEIRPRTMRPSAGLGEVGGLSGLSGRVFVALDRGNLGGWRPWVDYPWQLDGHGSVRAWGAFEDGRPIELAARVALQDVVLTAAEALPTLRLTEASGLFGVRRVASRGGERLELTARRLALTAPEEDMNLAPFDADASLTWSQGDVSAGKVQVDRLELAALSRLSAHFPLPAAWRAPLAAVSVRGRLEGVQAEWPGGRPLAQGWSLRARFAGLATAPWGQVPGVDGLSGEIDGDWRGGRYRIEATDGYLDLPAVFPEARIALAALQAQGDWTRDDGVLTWRLRSATFENADAAGHAEGVYRADGQGAGDIDLRAQLTRADGRAVWKYLPRKVNEHTRQWLQQALKAGSVSDARLVLKGPLAGFPYHEGEAGEFLVTVPVSGAELHYAEGWPDIDRIDGTLRFEGAALSIEAPRARMLGVGLADVTVRIPELDAPEGDLLLIRGKARGPTAEFLRFIDRSPVAARIGGFTTGMQARGQGELTLSLDMPLRHVDQSDIQGEFRFAGNTVTVLEGMPSVDDASGRVNFTGHNLTIPEIKGNFLGRPLSVRATTQGEAVHFELAGGAHMAALQQLYGGAPLTQLSGEADWQGQVDVTGGRVAVAIRSDLRGVASALPAPLHKAADAAWPSTAALRFEGGGKRRQLQVDVGGRAGLALFSHLGAGGWEIDKGGVGIGAPVKLAARGLMVVARVGTLDVDAWRDAWPADVAVATAASAPGTGAAGRTSQWVSGIDLRAERVQAFGQVARQVELGALADEGGWTGRIVSDAAEGTFDWRGAGLGKLSAHFERLSLGGAETEAPDSQGAPDAPDAPDKNIGAEETLDPDTPSHLPALSVTAEHFELRGMKLGQLLLEAHNSGGVWQLDAFELHGGESRLTGSGHWRPGSSPRTEVAVRLDTQDIGTFLSRIGYPEVVNGGRATLNGRLDWRGGPTRLHLPSLGGTLALQAEAGQFRKLEPGVGRLLGVLSLQALPRRLTLDFRDVFSEGFAFDRISGSIELANGELNTQDLQIAGPSARVWIAGSANVVRETQALRVTVQPTLSESVAIGAAAGLINPVAGVVTYLAQKALSDPIEKMFAFGYAISGSWAEPKVEKLFGGAGGAPAGADGAGGD